MRGSVAGLLGLTLLVTVMHAAAAVEQLPVSTPAECGPGSASETDIQGRVPGADHESGRASEPYTCNTELVGSIVSAGGYKVLRYVDDAGNECAYYDTASLFPIDLLDPRRDSLGVFVVDMADPSQPQIVDRLVTPAMLSPHESLVLNQERGILAAVTGNPAALPGIIDLYDVTEDCRAPRLLSSSPLGIIGHESGFAPDGRTFYASSPGTRTIAAVDVSDPSSPQLVRLLTPFDGIGSHGVTISEDGNRAYLTPVSGMGFEVFSGIAILDVSEIQARVPNPQTSVISTLTWPEVSIPQVAIPVTIDGRAYLVEVDEFSSATVSSGGVYDPAARVGAARIIDISDETAPFVVSNLRLAVHEPEARAGATSDDPGAQNPVGGYAAHFCSVPRPIDPEIVACSMILSGLRVFDIRDPHAPREIAYYNAPGQNSGLDADPYAPPYAMSAPAFAAERNEIWYSDFSSGFHVVRLTNGVWDPAGLDAPEQTPASDPEVASAPTGRPTIAPVAERDRGILPATGAAWGVGLLGLIALLAANLFRRRSPPTQ